MEVQNQQAETESYFFIQENDEQIGAMYYHFAGHNKIVIDHTEVDKAHEGKGLGKQLVKAAVEYARANGVCIIPVCPFAKKIMQDTIEFQDVLFKS